jgi:hypothetical protein
LIATENNMNLISIDEFRLHVDEKTTEDDIDSILLSHENMHRELKLVFTGGLSVKERLIELAAKYGASLECISDGLP